MIYILINTLCSRTSRLRDLGFIEIELPLWSLQSRGSGIFIGPVFQTRRYSKGARFEARVEFLVENEPLVHFLSSRVGGTVDSESLHISPEML